MVIAHVVRVKSSGLWHVYLHSVVEAAGSLQMLVFSEDHEAQINLRVQTREAGETFESAAEAYAYVEKEGWLLLTEFTGRGWAHLVRGLL